METDIQYERFLDCVHCGLCTAACPTYVELGDENDSPRGRIHLMRNVVDGKLELTGTVRRHIDLCLDCRACETACPSGVQYGRLIEPFRVALAQHDAQDGATPDWFVRSILLGMFPRPQRLRLALVPARIAQWTGIDRLAALLGVFKLLPPRLRQLVEMLPPLEKPLPPLPERLPAIGTRRARVALFTGCVADVIFRGTHWATARVLQHNGCEVVVPRGQTCCGAIHFHAGEQESARRMADENIDVFSRDAVDAVVVNVAGCGAMLKDYGHHWHDPLQDRRGRFAAQIKDVHEFLDELGPLPPSGPIPLAVTYHDACHLGHAQKITEAPRRLLALIPELEIRELPESALCCGAAGTYNLTQPEMAGRLSRRKLENILTTRATTVVTANAGCLLQIAREARSQGRKLAVVHPMDLLDRSYRASKLDNGG